MGVRWMIAVVCVTLWTGHARAFQEPSLAELARRERARRATLPEPTRIYTNEDLEDTVPVPAADTGRDVRVESNAGARPEALSPGGSADEPTTRGRAYWHGRLTSAHEERQLLELAATDLQQRIDTLWMTLTARDDPFQRAELEQQRTDAMEELAGVRSRLERIDQMIRDIREEARRAGVPPGWLR